MNDHDLNDINDLLRDAVADVEPVDRLAELRARTATSTRRRRSWVYAGGGAVLAAAASVTAFAVLSPDRSPAQGEHADEGVAASTAGDPQLVPAYFLGDTVRGKRLFREFDEVPAGDRLEAAITRLQQPPSDPDYEQSWSTGTLESASLGNGTIDVVLGDHAVAPRPDDLTTQQVVYTLQGTIHQQLPVRFVRDGRVVLGPVSAEPELQVLNPVNISDPVEGATYAGAFIARGRGNAPDETVTWQLRTPSGTVVLSGRTTAKGTDDRLYPWETRIELGDVPAGTYTFVAAVDRPTDPVRNQDSDTRTITVR